MGGQGALILLGFCCSLSLKRPCGGKTASAGSSIFNCTSVGTDKVASAPSVVGAAWWHHTTSSWATYLSWGSSKSVETRLLNDCRPDRRASLYFITFGFFVKYVEFIFVFSFKFRIPESSEQRQEEQPRCSGTSQPFLIVNL